MALLKGKQIEGIQQQNMLIETNTITAKTSTTNKEYCDKKVKDKVSKISFSSANINMEANTTYNIGDYACNESVNDTPISPIIVKINGVMINVGEGLDAYFLTDDESTIRSGGNAQKGDNLIWNTDVYNLDSDDEIDFIYLRGQLFGFDKYVYSIIQDNDKYVIGGMFTEYQGQTASRIIRLNQDGSIDTTFNSDSGFLGMIITKIYQDGDKYLIGGAFTTYQGQPANCIIRLNQDGSIDTTFNSGTSFNYSEIYSIIQDGDKYLVGGTFNTYQEQPANRIIRLNQDGSIDNTFNSGTGFDNIIQTTIQDGNKYVIGGSFTTYQGQTTNRIIRLNQDGSIDTTFNSGTGFNNNILSIIQDGDKYLVGGSFTTYQGQPFRFIIRLNQDGSIDTTFNSDSGFLGMGITKILQDGDKYVIGGYFTSYQGQPANCIIRLNQDGSIDTTFNSGTGFNNLLFQIIQDGDKYVIGGYFTTYQDETAKYIIKLNQDGSIDTIM